MGETPKVLPKDFNFSDAKPKTLPKDFSFNTTEKKNSAQNPELTTTPSDNSATPAQTTLQDLKDVAQQESKPLEWSGISTHEEKPFIEKAKSVISGLVEKLGFSNKPGDDAKVKDATESLQSYLNFSAGKLVNANDDEIGVVKEQAKKLYKNIPSGIFDQSFNSALSSVTKDYNNKARKSIYDDALGSFVNNQSQANPSFAQKPIEEQKKVFDDAAINKASETMTSNQKRLHKLIKGKEDILKLPKTKEKIAALRKINDDIYAMRETPDLYNMENGELIGKDEMTASQKADSQLIDKKATTYKGDLRTALAQAQTSLDNIDRQLSAPIGFNGINDPRVVRQAENLRKDRHNIWVEREALKKAYLLNQSSEGRQGGMLVEPVKQFIEAAVQGVPGADEFLNDFATQKYAAHLNEASRLYDLPTTKGMNNAEETTLLEDVGAGTGGIVNALPKLMVVSALTEGVGGLTGLSAVTKGLLAEGSPFLNKLLGHTIKGIEEGAKFKVVFDDAVGGVGFYGGQQVAESLLPKFIPTSIYGKAAKLAINYAIKNGLGGGAIGMSASGGANALAQSVINDQDFSKAIDDHFGDTLDKKGKAVLGYLFTGLTVGALGVKSDWEQIKKSSEETAKKLVDAGLPVEAQGVREAVQVIDTQIRKEKNPQQEADALSVTKEISDLHKSKVGLTANEKAKIQEQIKSKEAELQDIFTNPRYDQSKTTENKKEDIGAEGSQKKIIVEPTKGYTFNYGSEKEIPKELQGIEPITKGDINGKPRLTFSGKQLIDAGLAEAAREKEATEPADKTTPHIIASIDVKSALDRGRMKQVVEVGENGEQVVKEIPFTAEDADVELFRLQKLAEKGKLTPEEYQSSYFGQSQDINGFKASADAIINDAVGFIEALRKSFDGKEKEPTEQVDVDVTDAEYNDFIDKGKVSEGRLSDIAKKVKNQEELSGREKEIFTDKTGEINKLIAEQKEVNLSEPITLHKGGIGKLNPDGTKRTAHEGVDGVFASDVKKTADRYGESTPIEIPKGTTTETVEVANKKQPISEVRKQETELINNSKAQVVILKTFDAKGEETQYIIKDKSLLGKDADTTIDKKSVDSQNGTSETQPEKSNTTTVQQGEKADTEGTDATARNKAKREEIKSSLKKLRDEGLLVTADKSLIGKAKKFVGKKSAPMSDAEIDAQMSLMDAMSDVWKNTTGKDNFYETFIADVKKGDLSELKKMGGALFQDSENPKRPSSKVTLAVFDAPQFEKMKGAQVAPQAISDLVKGRGKQIEKDIVNMVLDFDKYKGQKRISFDEFRNDVETQVMKLEKIRTSSYATYGSDKLGGNESYGEKETIIFNSPIEHGEKGHFSGDFTTEGLDKKEWELKQIPNTDKWAAMDKNMPGGVTADNIAEYVGTAGSKAEVEKWISDRDKEGSGGINKGLFGHVRRWFNKRNGIFHIAELQSDYFQKNKASELMQPKVSADEIDAHMNKNVWAKMDVELANNVKEKTGITTKVVGDVVTAYDKNGNVIVQNPISGPPLGLERGQFETQKVVIDALWELKNKSYGDPIFDGGVRDGVIRRYAVYDKEVGKDLYFDTAEEADNFRHENDGDLNGYKKLYEETQAEYRRQRNDNRQAEEQKFIKQRQEELAKEKPSNIQLKQFVASQKVHELRLLREAIKLAADEGAETVRFPDQYTLAVIEGYTDATGEGNAPYEVVSGDSDRLYEGDIINYGGDDMIVVEQDRGSITVAPKSEVSVFNIDDLVRDETDNRVSEIKYEARRHFNDLDAITKEEVDSYNPDEWMGGEAKRFLEEYFEENEDAESVTWKDIESDLWDSVETDYQEMGVNDLVGWADKVYQDGDTIYALEGRNWENFQQPDQYESSSNKDDYYENLDSDQKTVVDKYGELGKQFQKMRPDAELVFDDNNMGWWQTKVTEADKNNPIVAFQEEGGKVKGAIDFANDNKATMHVFDGADISTLAHEFSGHLGRRVLEKLAETDKDFAKQYNTVKKWAGVKDVWTTKAEEKFARAFEKYLVDGNAPTKALREVFGKLKQWIAGIYKTIKGSSIDIKLTQGVRETFDSLLGKEAKAEPIVDIKIDEASNKILQNEADRLSYNDQTVEGAKEAEILDGLSKSLEDSQAVGDGKDNGVVNEVKPEGRQEPNKQDVGENITNQGKPTETVADGQGQQLAGEVTKKEAVSSDRGPTVISKEKMKDKYGKVFEHETVSVQQHAEASHSLLSERAADSGISIDQEAKNHADKLISTEKNVAFSASAYDILTTAYHLSNLEHQLGELQKTGDKDAILLKEKEISDVNDLILQKLGRTSGENLNLFASVYKRAEGGVLQAEKENFARALHIDKMPETEEELNKMTNSFEVKPYFDAIQDLKKQLEAERSDNAKRAVENDKVSIEKYIKNEVEKRVSEAKSKKGNKVSTDLRSYAKKIRESDMLDNLGLGKSAIDDATTLGVTFNVKEALAKTLELMADGVDKAEAIAKALSEHGIKGSAKFSSLVDTVLDKQKVKNKEETLGKIKEISNVSGEKTITKDMVSNGLIKDIIDSHIHSDAKADEVIKNALDDIKKVLPDTDINQLTDAILKRGDFKDKTKAVVESEAAKKSADVKRIAGKIEKENSLTAANDIHKIETDNSLTAKERKAKIDARKTEFEKELDKKIESHEKASRDAVSLEKEKVRKAESEAKRVDALNEELDRITARKEKEATASNTKQPIERSEREKEIIKEIEKQKKEWDNEKKVASKNKSVAKALETERKRQADKEAEINKKIADARELFRKKNPKAPPKTDTPEIEALKKQLSDTRKDTAERERGIVSNQRLADRKAEIQQQIDYVKSQKKIFESAIKDKKKTASELSDLRKELKDEENNAGIRRQSTEKGDIKTAKEYDEEIKSIESDSNLTQDEKDRHVAELKAKRNDAIGKTKQGVLANLNDSVSNFMDELASDHADAIASGDVKEAKAIIDIRNKMLGIKERTKPTLENAKDRIDKADQDLQKLILDYRDSKYLDRLQEISDANVANWNKTAKALQAQNLLDAAKRREREANRRLAAGQYSEIPTSPYDQSRNNELSAQNLRTKKAWQKVSALKRDARSANDTWVDTALMIRAKTLIASLSAIEKVGISGITKPIMDTLIKQSFGRIASKVTGVNPVELRSAGKSFKSLVTTTASVKRGFEKVNKDYVDALKKYDEKVAAYGENSRSAMQAKKELLKAEIDQAAMFPYLFINANSALDMKEIMIYGATNFDEQIGAYNKSYSKDRTKLQEVGHWFDGINRSHGAIKSVSSRQAMMDGFMENLQYFQKQDGEITPENKQLAFDLATVSRGAEYKTGRFGEETWMSKEIGRLKSSENKAVRYTSKYIFPVAKIAVNIAKQSIDIALPLELAVKTIKNTKEGMAMNAEEGKQYSNFASKWKDGLKKGVESLDLEQKKFLGNLIAKGAFGLTQYLLVGWLLGSGKMKYGGAYNPLDPFHQKMGVVEGSDGEPLKNGEWEIDGVRFPHVASIAINHSPYFMPASLAALYHQQMQRADESDNASRGLVAHIVGGELNEVLNRLPFLGAIDLMLALTGDEYQMEHLIADLPPSMRNVAQITDKDSEGNPVKRDTDAETFFGRVGNIWKSNMPILNKTLPEKDAPPE